MQGKWRSVLGLVLCVVLVVVAFVYFAILEIYFIDRFVEIEGLRALNFKNIATLVLFRLVILILIIVITTQVIIHVYRKKVCLIDKDALDFVRLARIFETFGQSVFIFNDKKNLVFINSKGQSLKQYNIESKLVDKIPFFLDGKVTTIVLDNKFISFTMYICNEKSSPYYLFWQNQKMDLFANSAMHVLLKNISLGILVFDENYKVIDINGNARDVLGLDDKTVLDVKVFFEIFPEDVRVKIRNGESFKNQDIIRKIRDKIQILDVTFFTYVGDDDNSMYKIFLMQRKISNLNTSSDQYLTLKLVEGLIEDVVFYVNFDNHQILLSSNAYRALGIDSSKKIATIRDFFRFISPDHYKMVKSYIRNFNIKEKNFFFLDIKMISTIFSKNWVRIRGSIRRNVKELYGVAIPFSRLDEIDLKHFTSIDILPALIDRMPIGILLKDAANDFRYVLWNSTLNNLIGISATDALNKRPEEVDELLATISRTSINFLQLNRDTPFNTDLRMNSRNLDTEKRLKVSEFPLYNDAGCLSYILGIVEDVTDTLKLEEELTQSEKMRVIGQVAGGLAHDFNNQLTGILGYATLIRDKLKDLELLRYADLIINASMQTSDLIKKLLLFSRKAKYVPIPIDFKEVLQEVTLFMKGGLSKDIIIETQLNAKESIVLGDRAMLSNAILNILLNARDSIPVERSGHIVVRTDAVEVSRRQLFPLSQALGPGSYLRIKISDNGDGIRDKSFSKIFEPFFTTKEEGTGMGLPAVLGTIRSHNGVITLNSAIGVGSTFSIYLPLVADIVLSNHHEIKGKGLILLIDDDELIRDVNTELLVDLGYEVITADSGEKGVEICTSNKDIDLVILDMIMPGMSGKKTFLKLKELSPSLSILIFSGHSISGEVESILKYSNTDFLQKPVERSILSQKVFTMINEKFK